MRAIKATRRLIESKPETPAARALADLVLALEKETTFSLATLYTLEPDAFDLAIQVLTDWRVDRYYLGKARLFDVSWQHRELREDGAADRAPVPA